jgi:class 3 adenylate cyclase
MGWLSLAFADEELERAFKAEFAEAAHRRHAVVFALAAIALGAFGAIDAVVVAPDRLHTLWWLRYAVPVPVFVLASAFGFVSAPVYARWGQWVSVAGGFVGLCGSPAAALALAPLSVDSIHYLILVTALSVLIVYVSAMAPIAWTFDVCLVDSLAFLGALVLAHAPWGRIGYGAFFVSIANVMGLMLGYSLERHRRREFAQQRLIEEERARSERLLHNMLPAAIAERLKRQPGAIADGFDQVTVLFADLVGFTPLSERTPPADVVQLLNQVFSSFDAMAARHGLEKIKTIGDAYMLVGGLPLLRADHAASVATMALEMRDALAAIDPRLALRIGLHAGPVIAGVIGTSKPSYDLWGDTVNTASRMESHGEPGEIHVSDACKVLLAEAGFALVERGTIEVKGKGPMRTWWLKGPPR